MTAGLCVKKVWAVIFYAHDRELLPTAGFSTTKEGFFKWFNNQKGYGFIARDSGGDVFVHYSAISGQGYRTLNEGERVEFTVQQGQKGPAAVDVQRLA